MENNTSALPPSYSEAVQENPIKQDKTDVENNESSFTPQQPLPTAPDNVPSYGSIPPTTEIYIRTGDPCPACIFGDLEPDYPCLGWLCAICCFPIGIIFCLLMKQKKCNRCDAEF